MRSAVLLVSTVLLAAAAWLWWRSAHVRAPITAPPPPTRHAVGPAAGGRSAAQIEEGRRRYAVLDQKLRAAETSHHNAPAPPAGGVPAGDELPSLDKEYIEQHIAELLPMFKECYELARASRPALSGRMVMRFDIVGDPELGGIVDAADIERSAGADAGQATDPTLEECMKATIESVTFPPPQHGGRLSVSFPFVFATE